MEENNNINNEIAEENKDDKLGLDPASAEDRQKIMQGYKKSLRNRVKAPLLDSSKGSNPIEVLKEEEKARKKEEAADSDFDMYDIFNYKLKKIEDKINLCLSLSRWAMVLGIASVFGFIFALSGKYF